MAWTVLSLLRAATEHLSQRGSDSARLESELLLGRVLGFDRLRLYLKHDMPVSDEARASFRELVRRRASGEPVAYILGEREFYGLAFAVDRRCLVPRPETEHLVDEVLAFIGRRAEQEGEGWRPRIVDAGTGSGCIAVALASRLPDAHVFATDVSADALEVARANAAKLVPDASIEFREGDWLDPVAGSAPFDVVVSNPPYIPDQDAASLPRDVRAFEPARALFSGGDAFQFHGHLLDDARGLLAEKGAVFLELPATEATALEALTGARREEYRFRTVCDLAGHVRVLVAERG